MEDKYEKLINQDPCGERILATMQNELNELYEYYVAEHGKDSDICESIFELRSLGDKLLFNDYFVESEKIVDEMLKCINIDDTDTWESLRSNWERKYFEELDAKYVDYISYFDKVARGIEEWD